MTLKKFAVYVVVAATALVGIYFSVASQNVVQSPISESSDSSTSNTDASANTPSLMISNKQIAEPKVIVRKNARVVELYDGKKLIKTYKAGLGFAPSGDKEIEGDGRTPEGEFYVFVKNEKSKFTVSLGLSYPNKEDAGRGLAAGLITESEAAEINSAIDSRGMPPQKTKLGGEIYIHGAGSNSDWTWGCIALNDSDILELFAIAKIGMPVTILP